MTPAAPGRALRRARVAENEGARPGAGSEVARRTREDFSLAGSVAAARAGAVKISRIDL
jgi:hypothetical protein